MNEVFRLFGTIGLNGVDKAESDLRDVTDTAESASGKITNAFKKIGAAVATYFAFDKIKDFTVNIVQSAANVQAETAQFEAAFKDLSDSATQMFKRVGEETGVFATRLQVTGTKAFSQFKGAGIEANEALQKTETFLNLASDAAAYYDISLEDAEQRIRSFLRGNVEAGDAIGLFTSESQRNSYAVEMYGKKWIGLTEAQKQNLMLKVAEDIYTQSGAIGQAARESDGLANVVGNLKEVWRQFLAVVGAPVLKMVTPIIQSITDKVKELQGKVEELQQSFTLNEATLKKWITTAGIATGTILGLIGAWKLGSVLTQFSAWIRATNLVLAEHTIATAGARVGSTLLTSTLKLQEVIWGLLTGKIKLATAATWLQTTATKALNTAWKANPVGVVLTIITAVIGALVLLYNKSEAFRNVVNGLWENLKAYLIPTLEQMMPALEQLMAAFSSIGQSLMNILIPTLEALMPVFMTLATLIEVVVKAAVGLLVPILTALAPILTMLTELLAVVTQVLADALIPIIEALMPIIESLGDVLIVVTQIITAVVIPIFKLLASAIQLILAVAVPVLKTLLNIFSTIFKGIGEVIKPIIEVISSIAGVIAKAVDAVGKGIGKIKGLFNFKWELPALKKPDFSISPKGWKVGDLLKGSIPKLSVKWNAEGAIFDKPTIFDTAYGLQGVGEAGAEAVTPIDKLQGYVSSAVKAEVSGLEHQMSKTNSLLASILPQILANMGYDIVLDDNVLVGKLAPKMDTQLGTIYSRKARY